MSDTVTFHMIQSARKRLRGVVQHTAMPLSEPMTNLFGCEVYLKMENLQRTGSFKVRGAYNKVACMTAEERAHGVVASSAGNHAQGVAVAAQVFGCKAVICMPKVAPLSKIDATAGYGADIVLHGDFYDETYEKAMSLAESEGYTFCHPFDDPDVIAGQGTIGLEIMEDLPDADVVIVPIGGGGLISGIAKAVKTINPCVRIIGVQAENMSSMKASIVNGHITTIAGQATLADGIAVRTPGTFTYEAVKEYVDEIVTVSEAEISTAILFLLERIKTVTEGAGACPVAALLHGKISDLKGKKVVAMISGGNIDVNIVGRIINSGLTQSWRKVYIDIVLPDRPHALRKLSTVIAEEGANVLSIMHERSQRNIDIANVSVSMELETTGEAHVKRILKALEEAGTPAILR